MDPASLRDALQPLLLGNDVTTTGRFELADITTDTTSLTVLFHWNHDPTTYGISFPLPGDPPRSFLTDIPVEDDLDWAADVFISIQEELDTGLIDRAVRTQRTGYVELDSA